MISENWLHDARKSRTIRNYDRALVMLAVCATVGILGATFLTVVS